MKKPLIFVAVVLLTGALSSVNPNLFALARIHPEPLNDERPSKVEIISKPEPHYTKEARKARFEGTIVLRAIFRSTGKVSDITFAKVIPENTPEDIVKKLAERCIKVAGKIKFRPAMKDGHPVSMYVQLEYEFHLE